MNSKTLTTIAPRSAAFVLNAPPWEGQEQKTPPDLPDRTQCGHNDTASATTPPFGKAAAAAVGLVSYNGYYAARV